MTVARFDAADDDLWLLGGWYEAAMVLGKADEPHADTRLRTAITALWSNPSLRLAAIGDRARWNWERAPTLQGHSLGDLRSLSGAWDHPAFGPIPFTSLVIRDEIPDGDDWLYAAVPMAGLNKFAPGCWSNMDASSRPMREPLEQSLANLILSVCAKVPIQIAAIGWEISGIIGDGVELCVEGAERYVGYVVKDGDGFRYWPTTVWA